MSQSSSLALLLGVFFFCLLFFLIAHDAVYIGLDGQKLLHLITGLSVAGVATLLLNDKNSFQIILH